MAGYIGSSAAVSTSGVERKKTFAITTSTSALTGVSYTPNFVHVFHNGIRLVDGTDYTATNGSDITLTSAAENGDEVVVISYATFQAADAYTKAEADSAFVSDPNGAVTVDGNGNVGIGAAVPSSDVDILGSSSRIRLDGSSASFQILSRNTADSTTNALTFDADSYTFNRAGSTKAVIDSSGNLGIGVTPTSKLHIGDGGVNDATAKATDIVVTSDDPSWLGSGAGLRVVRTWLNTSWLQFLVSNGGARTAAMGIDAAGRVTTPSQPAFFASGNSGWITTTSGGIVPLGAVGVNIGNGYNISSYAYTAPVSGLYYVSLHAYLDTTAQIVLKKNGSDYVSQNADTSFLIYTNGNSAGSASGVIYLNAGDYIQMSARTLQSALIYTGHSHFSGYLIG